MRLWENFHIPHPKTASMSNLKNGFLGAFFLLFLTFFQCSLFGQTGEDQYIGQFENKEAQLSISVGAKGDYYEGNLVFQGVKYPFSGSNLLGTMTGNYYFQNNIASFILSKLLDVYYFTADGVTITIEKKANNPAVVPPTNQRSSVNAGSQTIGGSTQAPTATGQRVSDANAGYSFQLPAGFQYTANQGNYTLSSAGSKIQIGVSPHNYNNLDQIRATATDVSDAASNTFLKTTVQSYGNKGLMINMKGTAQGQSVSIVLFVLLSPYGGGTSIAGAGTPNDVTTDQITSLKSIANSVQFIKPQVSAEAQQWRQQLAGKRLTYLYTGSGYSEKKVILLCSTGRYERSGDDSYISNDAYSNFSAAGQNGNQGTWKIISRSNQAFLLLLSDNGSTQEYSIVPKTSGQLLLSNKRYFIETADCN
jgi:hypothetical protein